MPRFEATYQVAPRGRATSFTESELPVEFSLEMKNRFINAAGGAEKRQGMIQLGDTVDGAPNWMGCMNSLQRTTRRFFWFRGRGESIGSMTPVTLLVHSGLDVASPLRSMQMEEKLIFFNGVDRNIFTEDGTTFKELKAIIERGDATLWEQNTQFPSGRRCRHWVTDSNVAINDLLFNATKDALR